MGSSIADFFIKIIKNFVQNSNEDFAKELNPEQINEILHLSKTQDVAHLVSFVLKNQNFSDQKKLPFNEKFSQEIDLAVFRGVQIDYELEFVSSILSKNQIRFIPLKGSVLRKIYPETWMRTSCDIDILVEKQSFEVACSAFRKEGYKEEGRTSHDISFISPSGTHVELHFDLIEDEKLSKCSNILADAWNNAHPIETNSFHYVFSNEFFCFYHLAHMAKHFLTGGCGVRSFLDYYLLRKSYQIDEDEFSQLLAQAELDEFEKQVYSLCKCWFEDQSFNETTYSMHEFILLGGVLGDVDNMVAVQRVKVGENKNYVRSRLFVPYSVLSKTYPVLKRHKWLTPFYQIKRWVRFLFRGGIKKSNKELTANKNISQENLTQKDRLLTKLRLK